MRGLIWTKHPGDILGEAIDFLTHGDAQHFAFLRADGKTVHEAYFPHVRDRLLTAAELPFVRRFRLQGMNDSLEAVFERVFDRNLQAHINYDIPDLFRYEFNIPFPDQAHDTICSVYGMATIREAADILVPLVRCKDEQVSPRDHLISPAWIEEAWP